MVQKGKTETAKAREARLAAELRANLQKRKAQARARRAGEADRRDEGIDVSRGGGLRRDVSED